jgi:nucleotide-binding universal stress UspA family protein
MSKTRSATRPRPFRSILSATDFSDASALALQYAAALATRSGGRLHVLHVNDPLLVAAASAALGDRSFAGAALRELPAFVANAVPADTLGKVAVKYLAETGPADRTIIAVAKRLGCDIVVVGTHGLSGANKLLIGSTTERLLRRTPVPLLAVPSARADHDVATLPANWPGSTIMAAVDFQGPESEVRTAADIARALDATLVLVHAIPRTTPPPWYRADLTEYFHQLVAKAQRRLESLAEGVDAGVRIDTRVLNGNPASELAAMAADEHVGLVVMHLRKGTGIFGARTGSITYRVLSRAAAPVLALPAVKLSPRRSRR